jgi:hypothetical protein
MKDTDPYFKKLKEKSIFLHDYCSYVSQNFSNCPPEKFISLPEFVGFEIDKNHLLREPVIKKIDEKFEIGMAGIFISEKNSGCDFHVDEPELRNVAINMLISSGVSHSIFKTKQSNSYRFNFKELVYEEKFFYLYNVTSLHSLINFNKSRCVFSIKFKDSQLSYNQLFKWCKENYLFENEDNY